ncbi:hypothetical protein Si077_00859 [Streptococcus infantarius subsp. infantarius]|nr:hypothetical protein [Streptococcus infantarius subsp. infantarius]
MALFDEPNQELYGSYRDYHPEITRFKTNQELEEEVEQLKAKVDKLEKCIRDLKYIVAGW